MVEAADGERCGALEAVVSSLAHRLFKALRVSR
jgi:hypothetical protein